jgi:hypothetical protein
LNENFKYLCATSIAIVGLLFLNINFAVGEKGANVNTKTEYNRTALMHTAENDYFDV